MSISPSFIFGGSTGVSSPEELARLRAIADALSAPRAPKNVGEGLSALGDALGYRMTVGKANDMQAKGDASASSAIMSALGGGQFPPAPTGGAAPSAAPASADASAPDGGGGSNYRDAIAGIESAGSGNYAAVGPTSPTLGRALGRYQVMEANVGPWSKAALGREVTPEEFLANPKIQDAVFDHQFGKYVQQYGNPQDAASAWFTGGPLSTGAKKKDVLGTTGAAYVDKFSRGLGSGGGVAAALSGAPQQVASLDPSAGMPAAPSPVAAALQLPQQGPIPQARPDVVAALNGAPAGPVSAPVSPMPQPGVDPAATAATAPAPATSPPLPTRQIGPDPMAPAPQAPDMSQYPVIAGGTSDAIQPGNGTPSMQDLLKLASNPWAMQKYGPIIQTLLAQQMKQTDPAYALDIATKRAGLALDQKKLGGSFTGDSMDAQAWNILQTTDPSSREYQTAYSIVSQPKTQLVQTANGMVPVQVPPQLPAWLKAPGGGAAGPAPGPAAAPAPGADASAAPQGAGGPAVPGAAIPGTKQPATETQARNGAISRILLNEVPTLGKTFQALADPKGQLLNALPGGVGNPWQSEEYQRAATAVKTSIANVLYSLSGASSNPGEVMKQIEVLTPAFGDKPGTITDKLNRFKTYVRSIATESNDPELQKSIEGALSQMDGGAAPAAGGKKVIDGYTIEEVQ